MPTSISSYDDAMMGKTGKRAAREAMEAQLRALGFAEDYIQERGDEISGYYDPRVEMGETAFQEYAAGRTPEGFAQNLEDISTGSAYQQILAPRMDAAQRQLAGSGLSRSSFGARRAGDVSQGTLLGIEGMLSGRQRDVGQQGYQALQGRTGVDIGQMNALESLMLQRGQVEAGGILGQAQAMIEGAQNNYNAMHNVGSGILGMFGGGGGGSAPSGIGDSSLQQQNPYSVECISAWQDCIA